MDSRSHRALIVCSLAACLVVGFLVGLQVEHAHGISAASRIGIALALLGAVILLDAGCCFAVLAAYNLARLWGGVEIREGGIVADLTAIPWARVRAYGWGGDDSNKLVLYVSRSIGLVWRGSVGFPIATNDRNAIDAAMSARFGAPVSALGRAAG